MRFGLLWREAHDLRRLFKPSRMAAQACYVERLIEEDHCTRSICELIGAWI